MTKTVERTKVVVRRLPPYLREEDFKTELEKVASGSFAWFRFCQGKASAKRQTYSRAYINFNDSKAVVDFKSKFDGFVFVGARGTQYRCAIEFAPYQRLPKQKSKTDHREGTIETDPDFIEFLENLDKEPVMLPSAQRQYEEEQAQKLASGEDGDTIVLTPLMQFIVNKHFKKSTRSSRRDRREDRRKESEKHQRHRSKTSHASPKVLLKTRPGSKGSESVEKSKKPSTTSEKDKKMVKVRAGHQAWVPKVVVTGVSSLDKTNDKNSNASETAESTRPNRSEKKGSMVESSSSGRGRGRRHKSGKSHPSKSPNSKVVWVPKTEKQGGE